MFAIIVDVISISSPHSNVERNMIWVIIMCSYASTCFCYRQFLFICVLCCTVNSNSISDHINAFFCYFCWNCLYLCFSSYREIILFGVVIVIAVHIVQWILPQCIQFQLWKIESVSEVTHTFYTSIEIMTTLNLTYLCFDISWNH